MNNSGFVHTLPSGSLMDNGVWWEERERERGWDKNRGRGDDTF
jgi:hypothetical protein